jgi:hypothetical protein
MADNIEDFNTLKTDSFLRGRVFSEQKDMTVSDYEKKLIEQVFKESDFLKESFPETEKIYNSIKLIDSNLEYDSYSFKYDELSYVIKINEDDDEDILGKENKILKVLKGKHLAPEPLYFNKDFDSDENMSVLLTTYEHGISEGRGEITRFHILLAKHLSDLHKADPQNEAGLGDLESYKSLLLSLKNYSEILPEEVYASMLKFEKFTNHLSILEQLKIKIEEDIQNLQVTNPVLCHLNLSSSRILRRENMLKFINFHESIYSDHALDLAFSIYNLELNRVKSVENSFIENYFKFFFDLEPSDNDLKLAEFKAKVNIYKRLASKMILFKCLCMNFYFRAMYGNSSPLKYISLMTSYESVRPEILVDMPSITQPCEKVLYLYETNSKKRN